MPAPFILRADVWQQLPINTVARIVGEDESVLGQADFDDWDLNIYDPTNTAIYTVTSQAIGTGSIDGSGTVVSAAGTLVTDGYWQNADDTGYNFRHRITKALLDVQSASLQGGKTYRFEYILNSSTWEAVPIIALYKAKTLHSFTP